MTLKEKIQKSAVEALKTKNETLKSCYSCLKAKINIAETSGKHSLPLSDETILECIVKEIKELEQSREFYDSSTDSYKDLTTKIEELQTYLPQPLSEEEVVAIIKTLSQAETNKGKLIGLTVKQVGTRYDKSKIAALVNKVL